MKAPVITDYWLILHNITSPADYNNMENVLLRFSVRVEGNYSENAQTSVSILSIALPALVSSVFTFEYSQAPQSSGLGKYLALTRT